MALNILSLLSSTKDDGIPRLVPGIGPALVGRLTPDVFQAAAECFPGNDGIDLDEGSVVGIQSGVAVFDVRKSPSDPCSTPPVLLVNVLQGILDQVGDAYY